MTSLPKRTAKMKCPYCLYKVPFEKTESEAGGFSYLCLNPKCNSAVPTQYIRDYELAPPVPLSIIGYRGHGKTVFIGSLLLEIERLVATRKWGQFSYEPVTGEQMQNVASIVRTLREGRLPDSTPVVLPKPMIVRLRNVPRYGDGQLLLYDTGGEALSDLDNLKMYGGYLLRSPAIVWLVSLSELQDVDAWLGLLRNYKDYLEAFDGSASSQALLVVLTKWDEFENRKDVPQTLSDLLDDPNNAPTEASETALFQVSRDIENWLSQTGYGAFVENARATFALVRYSATSAYGPVKKKNSSDEPQEISPRGVIGPFMWALRYSVPRVIVQTAGERHVYFSLNDAIDSAPNGAVVRLSAGAHWLTASLRLTRDVSIEGQDANSTCVICQSGHGIVCQAEGRIELMKLRIARAGSDAMNLIEVTSGDLRMADCRFNGGAGADHQIPSGMGMLVTGKSRVDVKNCQFVGNAEHGICATDESSLSMVGCKLANNRGFGVYLSKKVRAHIGDKNSFLENLGGEVFDERRGFWKRKP